MAFGDSLSDDDVKELAATYGPDATAMLLDQPDDVSDDQIKNILTPKAVSSPVESRGIGTALKNAVPFTDKKPVNTTLGALTQGAVETAGLAYKPALGLAAGAAKTFVPGMGLGDTFKKEVPQGWGKLKAAGKRFFGPSAESEAPRAMGDIEAQTGQLSNAELARQNQANEARARGDEPIPETKLDAALQAASALYQMSGGEKAQRIAGEVTEGLAAPMPEVAGEGTINALTGFPGSVLGPSVAETAAAFLAPATPVGTVMKGGLPVARAGMKAAMSPVQTAKTIGKEGLKAGKFFGTGALDVAKALPEVGLNIGKGALQGAESLVKYPISVPKKIGKWWTERKPDALLNQADSLAEQLPHPNQVYDTEAEAFFKENLGSEAQKYTDPEAYFYAQEEAQVAAKRAAEEGATKRGLGPTQTEQYASDVMQGTPEEQIAFRQKAEELLSGKRPETELELTALDAEVPKQPAPSVMPSMGAEVLDTNPSAARVVADRAREIAAKAEGPAVDFADIAKKTSFEIQVEQQGKTPGVSQSWTDMALGPDMASPELEAGTRAVENKLNTAIDRHTQIQAKVLKAIDSRGFVKKDAPYLERLKGVKRQVQLLAPDAKVWLTNGDLLSMAQDGLLKPEEFRLLPERIKRAVNVFRKMDDDLARMKRIMNTDKYMKDHFAHVFTDAAVRRKMLKVGDAEITPEGWKVTDKFLKERSGSLGYTLDPEVSMKARTRAAYKEAYLGPWQNWMREKIAQIPATDDGKVAKAYWEKYVNKVMGNPGKLENKIDRWAMKFTPEKLYEAMEWGEKSWPVRWTQAHLGGIKPISSNLLPAPGMSRAIGGDISNAMYTYLLSFNLGTALKNMLQVANTVAMVGPAKTLKGASKMLTREGRAEFALTKEMIDLENTVDGFSDGLYQNGVLKAIEKAGMLPMRGAEWLLRGTAFHAGLYDGAELAKRGMLGKGTKLDIWNHALAINHDANFHYGVVNTNPYFQNPVGRVLKTLGTYPLLQAGFYKKLATAKNEEKLFGVNAGLWRLWLTQGLIVSGAAGALDIDLADAVGAKNVKGVPVPMLGTGNQLKDFYANGAGPGGQAFGLLDFDKVNGRTWGQRAKGVASMYAGGKLRYPGRTAGQINDYFKERKSPYYAETRAQEAPLEAAGKVFPPIGKLAGPRKKAYKISKTSAQKKFFGLRPPEQQEYLERMGR